jgi:predicted kinase
VADVAIECVIFTGLPGAGKTTYYRRHFEATHRHVSKDHVPHQTARDQRRLVEQMLARGESVVVDNTHPAAADRAPVIAAARASGAAVTGYFFDVTPRQAVARNAQRSGRDKVPNVAIFTCAKRLEPPQRSEGYDRLFRVTIGEDREFRVEEVEG